MNMNYSMRKMVHRYEQMQGFSEREFERRWAAVRELMDQRNVDAMLVVEGYWEGETQWLLGLENTRHCDYVVIPKDGALTAVFSRKILNNGTETPLKDQAMPWNSSYTPIHPEVRYVVELSLDTLRTALNGGKRLGVHNYAYMSAQLKQALSEQLPDAELVNVSADMHVLSAVKSEEELTFMHEADKLNEKVLYAAASLLRPGRTIQDVVKQMVGIAIDLGSDCYQVHECAFAMGMDGAEEQPPEGRRTYPGEVIRTGQRFMVISETNGVGGIHTAIGRPFVVGQEPCERTQKAWQAFLKAQDNACRLMKTGARLQDVYNENYRFINQLGYQTNVQQYIHGIGYCYAERPYLHDRRDCGTSFMPLRRNTTVICHPIIINPYVQEGPLFGVDTVLIGDDKAVITNRFPRQIIVT